ncbi:hypothetical protein PG991_010629 [Apiospora marii]|uniref:Nitrate/nitrite sensing protein domain-containing protein n=1 Tax=Apiospora marii TaxID=335849 RepID=A0ABR1RBU0_9PEZI
MVRTSRRTAKFGLVRVLRLLLGAVAILIAVLLLDYPVSHFMGIIQLRQLRPDQWAEKSLPPCQSAICVMMSDVDRAGGTFARALTWVNESSGLTEEIRLANMEDALAISDSLRRMAKKGRDLKVTRRLADEYSEGLWRVGTSWNTMRMRLRLHGLTMSWMLSSLESEVDTLSEFAAARFHYAERLGDPESYYLTDSELMSLEDKLYVFLDMTIRVFDRIKPAATETHENASALLATLGQLRDAIELEHRLVQFDQKHRLRGSGGGGLYVCSRANMCGLTGPLWVSAAELRGVQAELVEARQKLDHALELVTDASAIAGDIMHGARWARNRLALASQADILLVGREAEEDILIHSKWWKLQLAQRAAQISALRG